MKTEPTEQELCPSWLSLTQHARVRMQQRRLPPRAVAMVMVYGRLARLRGAEIYAIGRKEVEHYRREGVDLSRFQGIQVVCNQDGKILTVYRNHDFRGLRQRHGRRSDKGAA